MFICVCICIGNLQHWDKSCSSLAAATLTPQTPDRFQMNHMADLPPGVFVWI